MRVQGHHADAGQPALVTAGQPRGDRQRGAVGDNVQQPAAGGVDQPRDKQRRPVPPGAHKGRLVHPKRGHANEPVRVVDQRLTVLTHRAHHRMPTHP